MKIRIVIEIPGLGEAIKSLRKKSGIPVEDLAKQCGCNRDWWYKLEKEQRDEVPWEKLQQALIALGVIEEKKAS